MGRAEIEGAILATGGAFAVDTSTRINLFAGDSRIGALAIGVVASAVIGACILLDERDRGRETKEQKRRTLPKPPGENSGGQ